MLSVLRTTAVALVAALALTACSAGGDGDPVVTQEPADNPSNAAASPDVGTLVGSDIFAVTLPIGWTQTGGVGEDTLFAVSNQAPDDIPTSVNVVEDLTLVQMAPDQLSAERIESLSTGGRGTPPPTDVTEVGEYEVDGEQGLRVSYLQDVTDVSMRSEEISVSHDETAYVITFSFSPTVTEGDRNKTIASVMDSWTWAA
ncbi:hypothetical protein [Aeromicrobium sp. CF3.5]|uniref:hypothetical protein n=1 Tax=Aeromicrobium sp. CF3.5 TaxID=3373078 RepID=UPI003EE6F498